MAITPLVIASGNQHKIREIFDILGGQYPVIGMRDIGYTGELPETSDTLEGNAKQKADYLHGQYGVDCFSEDTGLEVFALGGEPGVHTAHFAGTRDPEANIRLLLSRLDGIDDRSAQFRTVIALWKDGARHLFEGIVRGKIARQPQGRGGFGYDPVFIPEGWDRTFAEMDEREKNKISHRYRALMALKSFLDSLS